MSALQQGGQQPPPLAAEPPAAQAAVPVQRQGKCEFFLEKKRRYCKIEAMPGSERSTAPCLKCC